MFEKIPPLIILISFIVQVGDQCFFGDACDESLHSETITSASVNHLYDLLDCLSRVPLVGPSPKSVGC
jgi:hypothetical protein